MTHVTTTSVQREGWIDTAKAVTITLIVVYHVAGTSVGFVLSTIGPVSAAWAEFSGVLTLVRIPLFFLMAGLLAASAVKRPLRSTLRPKVLDLWWVFLVWSLLFAIPYGLYATPTAPLDGMRANLQTIPQGGTAYWFIFALPIFFLAGKLFERRLPALVALASALYLLAPMIQGWVASALTDTAGVSARRLAGFLLFYAIGLAAPALIRRVAQLRWWTLPLFITLFVGVYTLSSGGIPVVSSVRILTLTCLGVAALLVASRLIAAIPGSARVTVPVAQSTLSIYVTHSLILYSTYALTTAAAWRFPSSALADGLYVPVVTAILVAAGVVFARAVKRLGVSGVLDSPRGRRPRVRRMATQPQD